MILALAEGFVATVPALAGRAGVDVDRDRLAAGTDGPLHDVQVSAATGMSAPPHGDAWNAEPRRRAAEPDRFMAR
ncbi:hypothetical protein [Streptomyces sp. NPDC093094]|uniref:hypothetical protein n=1 Tax=Streptomyces sp. NPDC093094 TaxID=3366026 RepID=UPI00381B76D0